MSTLSNMLPFPVIAFNLYQSNLHTNKQAYSNLFLPALISLQTFDPEKLTKNNWTSFVLTLAKIPLGKLDEEELKFLKTTLKSISFLGKNNKQRELLEFLIQNNHSLEIIDLVLGLLSKEGISNLLHLELGNRYLPANLERLLARGADPLALNSEGKNFWEVLFEKGFYSFVLDLLKDPMLSKDHLAGISFSAHSHLKGLTDKVEKDLISSEDFMEHALQTLLILEGCGEDPLEDLSEKSAPCMCYYEKMNRPDSLLLVNGEGLEMLRKIEERFIGRVLLGGINSIEDTQFFPYDGWFRSDNEKYLSRLWDFFAEGVQKSLPEEEQKPLIAILQAQKKKPEPEELYHAFQNGEIIAFPTSCKIHDVYIIMGTSYLIIANTGARSDATPTLEAFCIDPRKVSSSLIKSLVENSDELSLEDFLEFVHEDLPKRLAKGKKPKKNDRCKEIERLGSPKEQTADNCYMKSRKAGMRAIAILIKLLKGPEEHSVSDRIKQARKESKAMSAHARGCLLEDFAKRFGRKGDPYAFDIAVGKLRKAVSKLGISLMDFLKPFPILSAQPWATEFSNTF